MARGFAQFERKNSLRNQAIQSTKDFKIEDINPNNPSKYVAAITYKENVIESLPRSVFNSWFPPTVLVGDADMSKRKHDALFMYMRFYANETMACWESGETKGQFTRWRKNDKKFSNYANEIDAMTTDLFDYVFKKHDLLNKFNPSARKWFLQTRHASYKGASTTTHDVKVSFKGLSRKIFGGHKEEPIDVTPKKIVRPFVKQKAISDASS